MAHSSTRPRSVAGIRRYALIAAVGVAALVGALVSPAAANAIDPVDAIISGTVTSDASGVGLDAVTVTAENDEGKSVDATTDENGSYEIAELAAGDYLISFTAPDETDYISEWYPNASADDATAVTLVESQEKTIDAGLGLGGRVTGVVRGVASALLADVDVEAYPYGGGALLASATTDASGAYELRGLPSTGVTVSFTDDADRGYVTNWSNNRANEESADKITVAPDTAVVANASLVIGARLAGQVSGPGGAILPEGSVEVTLASASTDEVVDSQSIDETGSYAFAGIAPGSYVVQFSDAGESGFSDQWWKNAATRQLATTIVLASGQSETAINASMTTGASLAGTVTTSATPPVPLANALVTVSDSAGDFVADAPTDAAGAYSITGLSAGSYHLGFAAPEGSLYSDEWWQNKANLETATPIVVAAGVQLTGYDAQLASAGAISGTVTGSGTPAPGLEGVAVTAYDDSGDEVSSAVTGASGTYLVTALAAGTYRLHFETWALPAYAPQWWKDKPNFDEALDVVVTAGNTTTGRNTVLKSGGSISGTVSGGSPLSGLPGVEVTAYDDEQNEVSTTQTTSTGRFTLLGVPAGSVTLGYHDVAEPALYLDEYWNNTASIDDADYFPATATSAITGKNATLAVGGVISGFVAGDDAPTVPLEGVVVELFDTAHVSVADAVTETDGRFRFGPLEPGTYKLSYTAPEDSEYGVEWWKNAASFSTASAIVIREASSVTADATLVDNPVELNQPPTPAVKGVARVGQTVSVSAGTWTPAPVELSYQWNSSGEPIEGAVKSTYFVEADYFETELSVTVTGGRIGYLPRSITSADTGAVTSGVLPTVVPVITGTLAVGATLRATTGNWNAPDVDYSFQWINNGREIDDATDDTYKLKKSDAGDKISVVVTGSAYGYDDRSRSSAASLVQKVLTTTPKPKISGTAKVGKKLKAKAGTWKPSGVSFSYQWKRNGVAIAGATKSKYKLVKADRKSKITVMVTGAKSKYTPVTTTSKSKKVK
jgi:hypothetical protein